MDFARAVVDVLRKEGPLKAAGVARRLAQTLRRPVDRREVNSVLYGGLAAQVTKNDDDNTWSLRAAPKRPTRPPRRKTPVAAPARSPGMAGRSVRITPTREQERLITFEPSGNLLIRGEAGSGKTTVLAARAGWIRSQLDSGSMLFLTYNRALAAYVTRILGDAEASDQVRVSTFHAWCRDTAEALGMGVGKWLLSGDRDKVLPSIVKALRARWGAHRL